MTTVPGIVAAAAKQIAPVTANALCTRSRLMILATTSNGGAVYFIDAFDNVILLKKGARGTQYFEPVPFRKTKKPFVRPNNVNKEVKTANVFISDIYELLIFMHQMRWNEQIFD